MKTFYQFQNDLVEALKELRHSPIFFQKYIDQLEGKDLTFNDAIVSSTTVMGINNVIRIFECFGNPEESIQKYKAIVNVLQVLKPWLESIGVIPVYTYEISDQGFRNTFCRIQSNNLMRIYDAFPDIDLYLLPAIRRSYIQFKLDPTELNTKNFYLA